MFLFGGKEDIVLKKGRENHKFVTVFHRKISCKELQALLQMYFGGMKFINRFSYLSLLHYKGKQLIQ